jgi:8-oxo-dGTP diphosphatase
MPYQPILATLGYVFSPDRQQVLMIHRTARGEGDPHFGKYNGLGGKLERDEEIVAGMVREIREEAGIEAEEVQLAGTISWPGFGPQGEDWFGFIFRITRYSGEPWKTNSEGTLNWIDVARIPELNLWPGDRFFLPLVLDFSAGTFHGIMPYENGTPQFWSYSLLR